MVDRWGRLTFDDGLQIAQTAQYFKRDYEREQDRKAEKDAYKVADAIRNKDDISQFSPEARYKGSKLYWDDEFGKVRTQTYQARNETEAIQQKSAKLKLNLDQAAEKLRVYKSARRSGNNALAKQLAVQISNEHMYNGRYIEGPERGEPGYKVTNWDGSKQVVSDMPIEQVDQLLGAYFDRPQDEIMQWQMSAEALRAQKNEEILSKAEPYINEKTNQVIYRVPAGTWDPQTGKPRGAFFVDSPTAETEIPKSQTKGFTKFNVAVAKAGLRTERLRSKKAEKDLGKPDIVSPGSLVPGKGGQVGVITSGPQRPAGQIDETGAIDETAPSGGLQFQAIPGLGQGAIPGGKGAPTASQQYNLMVKQLETELMPFIDKGQSAIDPETLQITNSGKNALMNAIKLAQKYQSGPTDLTDEEKAIAQNAVRAVQIYQSISDVNKQSFGLQSPQAGQSIAAPPPGFIMD